jgi:threonine dehydrogenase-like Zn-dependent dehydrogenase
MLSRAAVLLEPGVVEMRDFPVPDVGEDDGVLRLEATGVCGSDVAAYRSVSRFYETPCVLGHEVVGTIEAIGPVAAARWNVSLGDRVVVEEYLPCGTCPACLEGMYQQCPIPRYGGRPITSAPSLWGGYSEFMYLAPQSLVHRVDSATDPAVLQLYVPVSNGLHWVQGVAGGGIGSTVVVIGPGPHGLGCVIGAREAGAARVILVGAERDGSRLQAGLALGADHALTAAGGPVADQILEITGGSLADAVVNAADSAAAFELAVRIAAQRATVVQAGIAPRDATIDAAVLEDLVVKLLQIKTVLGRPSRMVEPALRLLASGRYPFEAMCSHVFGLEETEEAFQAVRDDPSVIRAVVKPNGAPTVVGAAIDNETGEVTHG